MPRYFPFLVLFLLSYACSTPESRDGAGNTHAVSCSAVHARAEPHRETTSRFLLKKDQPVTYLRETFYTEKIKVQNRYQAEKWVLVSFLKENNQPDSGWVYGGCLRALPGSKWKKKLDQQLYLANRYVVLGDCGYDLSECAMLCECDCCFSDLYFMPDGYVYEVFSCCCDNPVEYRIGRYAVAGKTLTCRFASKIIDDPVGYEDNQRSAGPPVYKEEAGSPLDLAISTCSDGTLVMKHEKSGEMAVFDTTGNCQAFLDHIRKSAVYGMLEKLKSEVK